jgi:hypothetical protein
MGIVRFTAEGWLMDRCNPNRRQTSATSSASRPAADEARLVPILARAAELGRGPPWLVGWVRGRLARLGAPNLSADPAVARRLARELAWLVRPAGLTDTVRDRAGPSRRADV